METDADGDPVYAAELQEAAVHAVPAKRLSGQGLLPEGRRKALIKNSILGLPEGIITMDVIVPFAFSAGRGRKNLKGKEVETEIGKVSLWTKHSHI